MRVFEFGIELDKNCVLEFVFYKTRIVCGEVAKVSYLTEKGDCHITQARGLLYIEYLVRVRPLSHPLLW
jgi:hypothetical protein